MPDPFLAYLRSPSRRTYTRFVAAYAPVLTRVAMRIVRSSDLADDVVQDVFVRLAEEKKAPDDIDSPRAYVLRAAYNRSREILRQEKTRSNREAEAAGATDRTPLGPAQEAEAREAVERVYAAIGELPIEYRLTLHLRAIEGLSYAEIARVLGITAGTVASRMHRARELIRQSIGVAAFAVVWSALDRARAEGWFPGSGAATPCDLGSRLLRAGVIALVLLSLAGVAGVVRLVWTEPFSAEGARPDSAALTRSRSAARSKSSVSRSSPPERSPATDTGRSPESIVDSDKEEAVLFPRENALRFVAAIPLAIAAVGARGEAQDDARVEFRIGSVVAAPGETFSLPIRISSSDPVQGFSAALDFDEGLLAAESVDIEFLRDEGWAWHFLEVDNSNTVPGGDGVDEGFVVASGVWSFFNPELVLPVGEGADVVRVGFRVRDDAERGVTPLRFVDGASTREPQTGEVIVYDNLGTINGEGHPPRRVDGSVTIDGPPIPPSGEPPERRYSFGGLGSWAPMLEGTAELMLVAAAPAGDVDADGHADVLLRYAARDAATSSDDLVVILYGSAESVRSVDVFASSTRKSTLRVSSVRRGNVASNDIAMFLDGDADFDGDTVADVVIGTLAPAPSGTRALSALSRPLSALEPLYRPAIAEPALPQRALLCTSSRHLTRSWRIDGRTRSSTLPRPCARTG